MISVDVIMTIVGCNHGKVDPKIKIKIKIYLKFNNKIIISKYT
jgi:DNA-binding XRE family transcriptional regulator